MKRNDCKRSEKQKIKEQWMELVLVLVLRRVEEEEATVAGAGHDELARDIDGRCGTETK